MKNYIHTKSSPLFDLLRRLVAGCAIVLMTVLSPAANASVFLVQFNDITDTLMINICQDGNLGLLGLIFCSTTTQKYALFISNFYPEIPSFPDRQLVSL